LELPGGEIGILLLPGFRGSQAPLTAWAHSLHQGGLTVSLPQVTVDATRWAGLNRTQWREGYLHADREFRKVRSRCSKVFLFGFGVGGAHALHLAEIYGDEIDGIILLEPSLPIHHVAFSKLWRKVEDDLYLVDQPTLLIYSAKDKLLNADDSSAVAHEISSHLIREVILEDSFHGSSLDHDGLLLVEESLAFINEVASGIWLADIEIDDEVDLIDAEFQSIIAGLALDESAPTTYLDELDRELPEEHFAIPDPELLPIADRTKRNAVVAMFLGPVWAILAAIMSFNPLGVEPWPGVLAFLGGLAVFLYRLRDDYRDDDGAIL